MGDVTEGLIGTQPSRSESATEVAWVLAQLVPGLSEATASDLRRLLSHSLTCPTAAERREARLGLLIDIVADGSGGIPGVAEYEAARAERQQQSQSWPSSSTLIQAYGGHWLAAVRSAMRIAFDGTGGKAPSSGHHLRKHPTPFRREEVAEALAQCWRAIGLNPNGAGPSQAEYLDWVDLTKRAARQSRKAVRLPTQTVVSRLWPNWERLVEKARPAI